MRKITHLVLHTAAHARSGIALDTSAAQIDQWHKANGWSGIGYHYVVRFDGHAELGRPEEKVGAGVFGFNANSLHICWSGHGDFAPPNPAQWRAALALCAYLLNKYALVDAFKKNPNRVLGHREVWWLRLVPKPIRKTCPGTKTNMKRFRQDLLARLG